LAKDIEMPRGPKGEKRPADVIGTAVMVGRIATGEIHEKPPQKASAADAGRLGGRARAKRLTPKERERIAKRAASARWKSPK
jgi:hypothetical protein